MTVVEDSLGMKECRRMSVRVVVEVLLAKPFDKGSWWAACIATET